MGKTLKILGRGKVPQRTIFNERFVAECCETFHFHIRNIRHEFKWEDFLKLTQAFKEIDETYSRHGRPKSHHHLELGRTLLNPNHSSQELLVELCENIYKKYPTGWDSYFHEEDSFIHLHFRDLRIEMGNAEFLEFAKIISQAYRELVALKAKTLSEVFDLLDQQKIIYAVLRNWENLPEKVEVGPHSDLDLIIHPDHVERFCELVNAQSTTQLPYRVQRRVMIMGPEGEQSYILVDLRQPGDGYFPDILAYQMLNRRVRFRNFWVLHPEDHLVGLAYHILFHKGYVGEGYLDRLKWLSSHLAKWPWRSIQGPSLMSYLKKILSDNNVHYVCPVDLTVRPTLPMLYPIEYVVNQGYRRDDNGQPVFSRVYKVFSERGEPFLVKQASGSFAKHEFRILSKLNSEYFPKAWGYEEYEGYSIFQEEYIEGTPLSEAHPMISAWDFTEAKEFVGGCIKILKALTSSEIEHRNICADHLLISGKRPVLISFGRARPKERPLEGLNGKEKTSEDCSPKNDLCDPYDMGLLLRNTLEPIFPQFSPLIETLLKSRKEKPVNWDTVDILFTTLEEPTFSSSEEKFLAYCNAGRYQKAEEILPTLGTFQDESIRFWIYYLKFINREESIDFALSIPQYIKENKGLLCRLIRECFETKKINQGATLVKQFLSTSIALHPDWTFSIFIDLGDHFLDDHFHELSKVLPPNILKALYDERGRNREWVRLWISNLCKYGNLSDLQMALGEINMDPKSLPPSCLSEIAQRFFSEGEEANALLYASRALDEDPYFAECAKILATLHEKHGNILEAAKWWRHYLTLNHDEDSSIKNYIGSSAKFEGDHKEEDHPWILIPKLTEDIYSKNLAMMKRQLEEILHTELGNHPILKKEYQEIVERMSVGESDPNKKALLNLEKVLLEFPNNALVHNDLGVLYYRTGDLQRAMKYFELAITLDPWNYDFKKNLADLSLELHHYPQAIKLYQEILAKSSEQTDDYLKVGYCYLQLGSLSKASYYFKKVLELDPENKIAKDYLALTGNTTRNGCSNQV
ncbi:MAG: tetratricopeptide repeat protein [Desulfobacterota bacterium]|nr:tetratricopeptide repeat protein [Thermodesulfobacteriota bacterium]